jgi:hypothetical protein
MIKYTMEPTSEQLLTPTRPPPGRANAVTAADVEAAAGALFRESIRPTIERVRTKIGRGSPNTIAPLLEVWWVKVARLFSEKVPAPNSLQRIPETVAQAAERLFIEALMAARMHVETEGALKQEHLEQRERHLVKFGAALTARDREMTQEIADLRAVDRRLREDNLAWRTAVQKAQTLAESLARRVKTLEVRLKKRAPEALPRTRNPRRPAAALRVRAKSRPKKRRTR